MKTVDVAMEGGLIQWTSIPEGVRLVVRYYDVCGSTEDLKTDEDGDQYVESIWEHNPEIDAAKDLPAVSSVSQWGS
jgi:hypothetical protein